MELGGSSFSTHGWWHRVVAFSDTRRFAQALRVVSFYSRFITVGDASPCLKRARSTSLDEMATMFFLLRVTLLPSVVGAGDLALPRVMF